VRPVIVGYDGVSPLGLSWEEQWTRAARGDSGIGPLTRYPLDEDDRVRVAGQVDRREIEPCPDYLKPRELAMWPSPIFRYGMLVVHRALQRARIAITDDIAARVGVTFSSAVGGLDAVVEADRALVASHAPPMPYVNPNSCANMITGKIAMTTGAKGPSVSTISACATGCASMAVGALLIESGRADVVLAGAVDFPLVPVTMAGFASMNAAYKPKLGAPPEPPERASRPLSLDRRGMVVSEGAACIVLAHPDFAKAHGLCADIELAGWAMTADAAHYVMPSRPTVARCMAEAIEHAGLLPEAICSVNAHATATRVGDKVEADALHDVFGTAVPPTTANKSQLGHAMGASSALEAMFAIEGMRRDTLVPTINYTPDPDLALPSVPTTATHLAQEHVLKNAFGFGGMNACVVFRRLS
jgi:3-oxoacyl-[acyl-carrier-protein] synthase II